MALGLPLLPYALTNHNSFAYMFPIYSTFLTFLAIYCCHNGLSKPFAIKKISPFHVFPKGCIFVLNSHIIPLPYHPSSNLPIFQLVPPSAESLNLPHHAYIATSNNTTALLYGFEVLLQSSKPHLPFQTLAQEYANMTQTQQDLYYWHVHLGHMNFASIQSMAWKEMGIP